MKQDTDLSTYDSWNTRVYDGGGDTGFVIEITREFNIAQQSEFGYMGALREPFQSEVTDVMLEDDDSESEQWEREQRQTLWAERGGYAAGLERPA